MGQLLALFFNVLAPVLAIIAAGYVAGPRLGLQVQSLSRLAYFVLTPAFVFNVISTAHFEAALAIRMALYIQLTFTACAAVSFGVARLLRRPPQMVAAYMLVATFANVGNFGLPIIQFRLGDGAMATATLYFVASNFLSFVIGVGVANWNRGGGPGAMVAVLRTPALLVLPPALLLNWSGLTLPLALSRPVALVAAAMIPLMLLTLGVQLAAMGRPRISGDVVVATAIRLLAGPALALLLAVPLGMQGTARDAGILQASMPTAVLASLIALQYDLVPEFVTTTVLCSTLASVLTLTVLLALL